MVMNKFYREPGNVFVLEVGKERIELRHTLDQNERYRDYLEDQREKAKAKADADRAKAADLANPEDVTIDKLADAGLERLIRRLKESPINSAEILLIALNPKRSEVKYSLDWIKENLDVDEMGLIASTWVSKKVFDPEYDRVLDPHLAPRSQG
jgi:hypothetical protein